MAWFNPKDNICKNCDHYSKRDNTCRYEDPDRGKYPKVEYCIFCFDYEGDIELKYPQYKGGRTPTKGE